jgi:hypothetical protein
MKVQYQIEGETSSGTKVVLEVGKPIEEIHNGFGIAIVLYEGTQLLIRDVKAVGLIKRERPKKFKL